MPGPPFIPSLQQQAVPPIRHEYFVSLLGPGSGPGPALPAKWYSLIVFSGIRFTVQIPRISPRCCRFSQATAFKRLGNLSGYSRLGFNTPSCSRVEYRLWAILGVRVRDLLEIGESTLRKKISRNLASDKKNGLVGRLSSELEMSTVDS